MNSPEELVKSFIVDYKIWNDDSSIIYNKNRSDGMEEAENNYQRLIEKYCDPEVTVQGISFGSESTHSLDQEKIVKTVQKGNVALIHSKHIDADDFESDYEYHLKIVNGSWMLSSILYVDADGKYECL
ncbi:hypothetical protein ACED29_20920 [Shewanella sp. 5S214]|uniref:hypothetical protein n=1 Tax=Shewanella sp. 5S214 TaxID=3229999 RepID=UPI00352D6656